MTVQTERLPYGIGRFSLGWVSVIILMLIIVGLGVYGYSQQLIHGEVVTGMRDIGTMAGVPWGLYVSFVVYFVGISFAGITIAALIRLFNLTQLKPVARMAELLTVVALILGVFCIVVDVGQPLRAMVNLIRYARPGSPFFATFTMVNAGYLFGSLVYLYLDGRRDAAILAKNGGRLQRFYRLWAAGYRDTPAERERHQKASFVLALGILPLLVTAHTTLGFVFGLQVGRPGWFGALQGPGFVALAGVSGVGMLMVITAILRRVLKLEKEIPEEIFKWLGNFLLLLTAIYLYFMVVELLTSSYQPTPHEATLSAALLFGEYAWIFWAAVGLLIMTVVVQIQRFLPVPEKVQKLEQVIVPRLARVVGTAFLALLLVVLIQTNIPGTQAGPLSPKFSDWIPGLLVFLLVFFIVSILPMLRKNIIASSVLSGVLVNLAAIGKRFLIVVPSQTHGLLLPYSTGSYNPTWVEYSIILGLFAFGTLLFILFVKVFPIMEIVEPALQSGD